jgi:hypothetical protein
LSRAAKDAEKESFVWLGDTAKQKGSLAFKTRRMIGALTAKRVPSYFPRDGVSASIAVSSPSHRLSEPVADWSGTKIPLAVKHGFETGEY